MTPRQRPTLANQDVRHEQQPPLLKPARARAEAKLDTMVGGTRAVLHLVSALGRRERRNPMKPMGLTVLGGAGVPGEEEREGGGAQRRLVRCRDARGAWGRA